MQVELELNIESIIEEKTKDYLNTLNLEETLQEQVLSFRKELNIPTLVTIDNKANNTKVELGLTHKGLPLLLQLAMTKLPLLITGEAGGGKTYAVEQVAKALDLPLYSMSVGEQSTKSDILGFIGATNIYSTTAFRKAFELGGIFLLDELDAGNPNVLLAINTGIANGFIEFPDKKVLAHANFQLLATANTYGKGGNTQYVGRNKLDTATLNRFAIIEWELDTDLLASLIEPKWFKLFMACREKAINIEGMLLSQRTAIYGNKMLQAGISIEDVISTLVTVGLDEYSKGLFNNLISMYSIPDMAVGSKVIIIDGAYIGKLGTITSIDEDIEVIEVVINNNIKVRVLKTEAEVIA